MDHWADYMCLGIPWAAPVAVLAWHMWRAFRIWNRYDYRVARRRIMWQSLLMYHIYLIPCFLLMLLLILDSDPPLWAGRLISGMAFPTALALQLGEILSNLMGLAGWPLDLLFVLVLIVGSALGTASFFLLALVMRVPVLAKAKHF